MRATWSVLVAGLLVWFGTGAWAASPEDPYRGFDWYEQQRVAQAQAQGITGEGVPVAVIGLGINPYLPVLADARLTVREPSFCREDTLRAAEDDEPWPAALDNDSSAAWNGSTQVAFIAGNGQSSDGQESVRGVAPGADIRFYAVGFQSVGSGQCWPDDAAEATGRAIVQAVDDGARIISLYDQGWDADRQIAEAVAYAVHEKVVVVVPSGTIEGGTWIQSLNGVVSVGAVHPHGWWAYPSAAVTVGAPGVEILLPGKRATGDGVFVGDSLEVPAALVAGMLADVAQRWPEATGDQLIQTLVANTAPPPEPPANKKDDPDYGPHGYGMADLTQMLAADPTQYPDVNPLVVPDDGAEHGLTAEDVRTAGRPAWAPSLSGAEPTPDLPSNTHDGVPRWVWFAAAGAALAGVAGVLGARAWAGAHRARHDDPTAEHDPTTENDE